ncbi:MAG: hypothetical protein JXO51_06690 [Candidatus Aminicenantes bacterium]|nr:hypothetical protein [Candidatus Aminicenantes bacterium]
MAPAAGRRVEIDVAKGAACLLMILAHLAPHGLLPVGNFAAALFFACSGMNAILMIERTRGSRLFDLYHVLFPLILFFGGSTLIAVIHGGRLRIAFGLLQFIALAIVLVFALSKLFPDPRSCGWLFPIPFLVQQLAPASVLGSRGEFPLSMLFGNRFVLFPWLGFFLFGIFILGRKRGQRRVLMAVLIVAFALSHGIAAIPLRKFWMSLSYILLGLLVIVMALEFGRWISGRPVPFLSRRLSEFFALSGRNSLMFLYMHYFVMRYFAGFVLGIGAWPSLLLKTLILFLACNAMLMFYEKVKIQPGLFLPASFLALALAWLYGTELPGRHADKRLIVMLLGILFAFLYVQLRRRAADLIRKRDASR